MRNSHRACGTELWIRLKSNRQTIEAFHFHSAGFLAPNGNSLTWQRGTRILSRVPRHWTQANTAKTARAACQLATYTCPNKNGDCLNSVQTLLIESHINQEGDQSRATTGARISFVQTRPIEKEGIVIHIGPCLFPFRGHLSFPEQLFL